MDQALVQVGLPVTCVYGDCKTHGFVKPASDYGGWLRRSRSKWYCPDHAKVAKEMYDKIVDSYKTPQPEPDTEAELYALLD